MGLSKEDWTLPLPPMMNKYSLVLVGGIYFKWRRERREIGLYTVEHFSFFLMAFLITFFSLHFPSRTSELVQWNCIVVTPRYPESLSTTRKEFFVEIILGGPGLFPHISLLTIDVLLFYSLVSNLKFGIIFLPIRWIDLSHPICNQVQSQNDWAMDPL